MPSVRPLGAFQNRTTPLRQESRISCPKQQPQAWSTTFRDWNAAVLEDAKVLELRREIYFGRWPDGRDRLSWPGIVHFRVKPKRIRFSDCNCKTDQIREMRFRRASTYQGGDWRTMETNDAWRDRRGSEWSPGYAARQIGANPGCRSKYAAQAPGHFITHGSAQAFIVEAPESHGFGSPLADRSRLRSCGGRARRF